MGIGRVYQQTFIDTYSRVADAKLYVEKSSISAANILNARVIPFYDQKKVSLLRVLTGRGGEFCGKVATKAYSPQTNGICERFHRTMKEEFYDFALRKKLYLDINELQKDADNWLRYYNYQRHHTGKFCYGKTPMIKQAR